MFRAVVMTFWLLAATCCGAQVRFLAVDNAGNKLLLVDLAQPAKGWSVPLPPGCRDLQLLDGGRVLVSHGDGAGEYELATGKSVWSIKGFRGVSTARRFADGSTLLGSEAAGGAHFVWADRAGKEIRHVDVAGCAGLRLVRTTPSGGLIFTAANPHRVVETDAEGRVIWTAPLSGKGYAAQRLSDGTTWATTGEACTVSILGRDGKEVRHLGGRDAFPQARLLWFSGFEPTADGGVVVANWCGHGKEKQGPHVVALDSNNKLLWTWEDHVAARTITNVLPLESDVAALPLDVRIENLTVLPSTGPLAHICVRNRGDSAVSGRLEATFPAAWKLNKTAQEFTLAPGQMQRIAFAGEIGPADVSEAKPGVLSSGVGWHVMVTAIGW